MFWGTYDTGKPRVRILIEGARRAGIEVLECHEDLWRGVEDKSSLSLRAKGKYLLRWLGLYPRLIWRYLRLPEHDAVCVLYMGQIDVLIIGLAARLRGVPVVWDVFISLYDTVTGDRDMATPSSSFGRALYALEWLGCRAADTVFIDTTAHARYLEETFDLAEGSVGRVFIGTEPDRIVGSKKPVPIPELRDDAFNILFFGQFIRLHGIETIVRAASILESESLSRPVRWIVAGRGQEQERIDSLIEQLSLKSVVRKDWIPHHELGTWMNRSDLCLGIFGTTDKAQRVIPNKVFEIIAARRPLLTADTPAIRELLSFDSCPCINLVPAGDPQALANAVLQTHSSLAGVVDRISCTSHMTVIGPDIVGGQFEELCRHTWSSNARSA